MRQQALYDIAAAIDRYCKMQARAAVDQRHAAARRAAGVGPIIPAHSDSADLVDGLKLAWVNRH